MTDYLQNLADRLRKGRNPSDSAPLSEAGRGASPISQQSQFPVGNSVGNLGASRGQPLVKAAGVGGIVLDFGGHTGNPVADRFNAVLGLHADPVQAQVAVDQRAAFDRALMGFAKSGVMPEEPADAATQMRENHAAAFAGGLDQQVVALVKAQGLGPGGGSAPVTGPGTTGDFNKSQMQLGGETLVGQSETDAAVIEMMKSMQETGAEDGEFVIDATEG